MSNALIATGIPFRPEHDLEQWLNEIKKVQPETAGIRRAGVASLDLAYVAAGRFDGFWEHDLKAWDIAAGVLLIQEAGGLVSDLQGNNDFWESGNVMAGNPRVHAELAKLLD